MPGLKWQEGDYERSLIFFPMVGAFTGLVSLGFYILSGGLLPAFAGAVGLTLIPVIITGGFHIDGFMDTVDAIRSYRDREEKLRILKDPHVGAFAVIWFAAGMLVYVGGAYIIWERAELRYIRALCISYMISRAVSGLLAMRLPKAKPEGMLVSETSGAGRGVMAALVIQLMIAIALFLANDPVSGILCVIVCLLCVLFYGRVTKHHFGGVTGDTAGYFLCVCETAVCVSLAVYASVVHILS